MSKSKVTIEQLFELGAHFGHRKRFWNPHMEDYIFCEKNNIHIIDLYKTQEKILELYDTFKNLSSLGNKIMIVGTKRVASGYVKDFGEKTGMPYIWHDKASNWKSNFEKEQKGILWQEELIPFFESVKFSKKANSASKCYIELADEVEKHLSPLDDYFTTLASSMRVWITEWEK